MLALLLAVAVAGPPAPPDPDLLHHFETREQRDVAGRLALHLGLQAGAAAFDLAATRRCLRAGTCREAHPLSDPDSVPYVRKAATFSAIAALTTWAVLTDHDGVAWTLTALAVAYQLALGGLALSF